MVVRRKTALTALGSRRDCGTAGTAVGPNQPYQSPHSPSRAFFDIRWDRTKLRDFLPIVEDPVGHSGADSTCARGAMLSPRCPRPQLGNSRNVSHDVADPSRSSRVFGESILARPSVARLLCNLNDGCSNSFPLLVSVICTVLHLAEQDNDADF